MQIKHPIFLILLFGSIISAQIIPSERRINWSPGLPNGIPIITSTIINVLEFGADSTGENDSYNAFVSAIDQLPKTGGVVFNTNNNIITIK